MNSCEGIVSVFGLYTRHGTGMRSSALIKSPYDTIKTRRITDPRISMKQGSLCFLPLYSVPSSLYLSLSLSSLISRWQRLTARTYAKFRWNLRVSVETRRFKRIPLVNGVRQCWHPICRGTVRSDELRH